MITPADAARVAVPASDFVAYCPQGLAGRDAGERGSEPFEVPSCGFTQLKIADTDRLEAAFFQRIVAQRQISDTLSASDEVRVKHQLAILGQIAQARL